jgi:hypothetical protein
MEGLMRKTHLAMAVLGAVMASSVAAKADEPQKLTGRVYLGIERLTGFGYTSTSRTRSAGATQSIDTQSAFNLNLFGASTYYSITGAPLTFSAPRLAVDVNVMSFLTVGLAAFVSWSSIRDSRNGANTAETVHLFGFGLAPRVGVTLPIGDRLIFWGRAGVTYSRLGSGSPTQTMGGVTTSSSGYESLFWVNVEPTLLVKLVEHVSVGATFVVDLPVAGVLGSSSTVTLPTGTTTTTSSSDDLTEWNVGLQLGLTASF